MVTETLKKLFERDLNKLIDEIDAYKNEPVLWKTDKEISNSAGNLTLHLIGNLNHFIGAQLGGTSYVRNRELEFNDKNVPKAALIEDIRALKKIIPDTLDRISDEQLQAEYPLVVFGEPMTTEYMLIHLMTHLSYHLGQINYHRRLLDA